MGNLLTVCVGEDEDKKYAKLFTEKYKVRDMSCRRCTQPEPGLVNAFSANA